VWIVDCIRDVDLCVDFDVDVIIINCFCYVLELLGCSW